MSQPEVAKMQASMIVWIGKEEKANDEIKDIVEKIATKLIILEPHNIDLSIAKARKTPIICWKRGKKEPLHNLTGLHLTTIEPTESNSIKMLP